MAVNRMFRICPSTGLSYHEPAEKLIPNSLGRSVSARER